VRAFQNQQMSAKSLSSIVSPRGCQAGQYAGSQAFRGGERCGCRSQVPSLCSATKAQRNAMPPLFSSLLLVLTSSEALSIAMALPPNILAFLLYLGTVFASFLPSTSSIHHGNNAAASACEVSHSALGTTCYLSTQARPARPCFTHCICRDPYRTLAAGTATRLTRSQWGR
jgi:hypothetical protein